MAGQLRRVGFASGVSSRVVCVEYGFCQKLREEAIGPHIDWFCFVP
jgi:hypothetical protein